MNDAIFLEILEAQNNASNEEFRLYLIEDFVADMVPQVPSLHQVKHQV